MKKLMLLMMSAVILLTSMQAMARALAVYPNVTVMGQYKITDAVKIREIVQSSGYNGIDSPTIRNIMKGGPAIPYSLGYGSLYGLNEPALKCAFSVSVSRNDTVTVSPISQVSSTDFCDGVLEAMSGCTGKTVPIQMTCTITYADPQTPIFNIDIK